jgi:hypothetical protein
LVHKLFIEAGVAVPPKYRDKLSKFEIVRGVTTNFLIRIQNLGDSLFPGGEIVGGVIRFEAISSMLTIFSNVTLKDSRIPKLKKNEVHNIIFDFTAIMSGPHSMKLKIRAFDSQDIEYYVYKSKEPSKDYWELYIYVIERENLDMLILLEEFLGKIGNKKKGVAER